MKNLTIEAVVNQGLCTGCGTCVPMCPSNSISIIKDPQSHVYLPKVDADTCNNCKLCLKVCPGHQVDYEQLNKEFLGKELPTERLSIILGNHIACYSGYSSKHQIRFDSSSGGLITQLLLFALETGLIDGALVTRMKKDNPLEPEPFIARTEQEIIQASKSKYCPVPANIALKEILEKDGKYAVVGLPCHLQGVRKAEHVNKKLRDRIVLHFGIICTHNDSFLQLDYLLQKYGINSSEVNEIAFRGKGWPGLLIFKTKSANLNYPFRDWVAIHEQCFFTPSRCLTCCDQSAELADLSFGDAWLPEFENDNLGTSVIISRTAAGEAFLLNAKNHNQVFLNPLSGLKAAESQGMMRFKKNGLALRLFIFHLFGKATPETNIKVLNSSFIDYPRSFIIFVNQFLASKRSLWWTFNPILELQDKLKVLYKKVL